MVRVSNNLLGILNILTFLISIPIIGGGIWLSRQANTECERFLDKPVIALGVFIMLLSIAGLVGACCRGAGEAVSGRGYKEYRLGDYSNWLQKRVNGNWRRIRSCIEDSKVCKSLIDQGSATPVQSFYNQHLSALQSGCCKPSDDCKFEYVSPTNWNKTSTSSFTNKDCNNWNNDPNILCYNCESCKAGLIDNIKSDWKKVAIINIIFIVFLIIVYTVGCCAFRNNRADNSWKRYP
nr:tetraspanin-8-like [Ipomoea batatas]